MDQFKRRRFALGAVALMMIVGLIAAACSGSDPTATPAPPPTFVPPPATSVPPTAMPATAMPATAMPATAMPATAMPATAMPATAMPATATPVPAPTSPPAEPERTITIVTAISGDTQSQDPHQCYDNACSITLVQITDPLINEVPEGGAVQPAMATEWTIASSGESITFKLRTANFHDGTPFNAEAVKFNIDRQIDPDNEFHQYGNLAYRNTFLSWVASADVIDDQTVRLNMKQPTASALDFSSTNATATLSPKAIREFQADIIENPVSTGPYKLAEWDKGVRRVLERNEDYWGDEPQVDESIYISIPDDTARLAALRNGTAQMIVDPPLEELEALDADAGFTVNAKTIRLLYFVSFNLNAGPLASPLVRQAINYAIDKETIASAFLQDVAVPAKGLLSPGFGQWVNQDVVGHPYNLDKARELLAEAGYPDGFKTTLSFAAVAPNLPKATEVATVLQASLGEIGIEVELDTREFSQFVGALFGGQIEEMALTSILSSIADPDNWYTNLFASDRRSPNGFNFSYFSNTDLDALLDRGRTTFDPAERKRIYDEAQALTQEDPPYGNIVYLPRIIAHTSDIENMVQYANSVHFVKDLTVN